MAITWSNEEIQKLVDCQTPAEREAAFPDVNPSTLKAHRSYFTRGLDTSGKPLGWTPVPSGTVEWAPVTLSPSPAGWAAGVEVQGDSGTICSGPVDNPITNWSDLLKVWGLDPEQFEVVEPVTFKAWDTPAKNEETQKIITKRLFSYKARIQRKKQDQSIQVDVAGWRERLQTIDFLAPSATGLRSLEGASSYVICVADPQLGKPGTDQAVENWKRGVLEHVRRSGNIARQGERISEIVVAFMGDEHEGVVGNYASQPYEVELNYTEQIQLDYDLRVWTLKQIAETGAPVRVVSVPSNHGEHSRFGSAKVMTSLYDNSSTMVTGLVKRLFDETQFADRIVWEIAEDRQDVTTVLNGVKANFSHGHIAKGSGRGEQRVKSAIERQILGRTEELGDAQLFFTAHYHHYYTIEDRGRTMFGCPALEAEKSSDWFYSQYGVWSRPGMLGVLVGSELGDRGWSEINVL